MSGDVLTGFIECAVCAAKAGSPQLCASCITNRDALADAYRLRADNERLRDLIATSTRSEIGECPHCSGSRGPNNEQDNDDCPAFLRDGAVR